MQRIEILQEKVGLPLEIGPSATSNVLLPSVVTDRVKHGRLWHLIAWSDDDSGTVGLWHKGRSIVFHHSKLDSLSIELMRGAKGPGWVALEARLRGQQPPRAITSSHVLQPRRIGLVAAASAPDIPIVRA